MAELELESREPESRPPEWEEFALLKRTIPGWNHAYKETIQPPKKNLRKASLTNVMKKEKNKKLVVTLFRMSVKKYWH